MEIRVAKDRIVVQTHVSEEEVVVESAYGDSSRSRLEALRQHGSYLLKHLTLTMNGKRLTGRQSSAPKELGEKSIYVLEYFFPERSESAQLKLEQDVLREFEYAPGNPWEATYVVRIGLEGRPERQELLLSYRQPLEYSIRWNSDPAAAPTSMTGSFIKHGIHHILTGYDHLLFVAALLLAVAGFWDLIKVITAFTLAHTLTLILSTLNLLRLPSAVVEPVIAASIVFVAVQNVFWPSRSRGRSRLLIAFAFGLFHGLGFAGGLLEAMSDLPGSQAALALVSFSLGVELGHQIVVIPLFLALRTARLMGPSPVRRDLWIRRVGSLAIAFAGAFYLVAALRQ